MNKREFLQKLREYLSYELPARYIEKNIRYYDEYIDGEAKDGKTAAEVIEELGDPQLIAKTIIDSVKAGADGIPNSEDDVDFTAEIYDNGGPEANQRASRFGSDYRDGYDRTGYGSTGNTSGQGGCGTSSSGGSGYNGGGQAGSSSGYGSSGAGSGFGSDGTGSSGDMNNPSGGWHVYSGGNGGCLITSILVFLIVFCAFSIFGTLLGVLSPVLAPIFIVLLIVWLMNRRR